MARGRFGKSVFDALVSRARGVMSVASGTLTMWDAEVGGSQHTDLLVDGVPSATVPVVAGSYDVEGPHDVWWMWADPGLPGGNRFLVFDLEAIVAYIEELEQAAAEAKEGAEAVGASSDAQTANNIENGPLSRGVLTAAIAAGVEDSLDGVALGVPDRGEALVAALDQKRSARLAVAGDSVAWKNGSGNYVGTDGNEWPKQLGLALGVRYPRCAVNYRKLNTAGNAYDAAGLIDDGTTTGTVFSDDFSAVAADLVGTAADVGGTWTGVTGRWSTDGSDAVVVSYTGSYVRCPVSAVGDVTLTATIAMRTDNNNDLNLLLGYVDSTHFLVLNIAPLSTGTVNLRMADGGAVTTVDTESFAACGITDGQATPQTINVVVSKSGTSFTATVGSGSLSYTLSGPQAATFAGGTAIGMAGGSPGDKITSLSATGSTPAAHTLSIDNGARGSIDAAWSLANLALIMPTAPDAVIIAHSHNHTTQTPSQFEASLDALVSGIRTAHGDAVPIIIAGQNPQYAPTANPTQHNTRQADLRRYARQRGFGYIPVFEAFMAQTNPQGLVISDGVHPTAAGIDLIGTTSKTYLESLSLKP